MRVAGSNRFYINPREENTLALMSRDGEISDAGSSDSLEEISAEAFKRRGSSRGSRSPMWMGFPVQKNYSPHLYNFAWAQAVQNKPLGFEVSPMGSVEIVGGGEKGVTEESRDSGDDVKGEKEEGELEEGEIGFGSEVVGGESFEVSEEKDEKEVEEKKGESADLEEEVEEMGEFDKRVSLILEELESITVGEVAKSFEGSCSRLLKCFESLKLLFSEDRAPVVDALVQQAVMGIQTLHSVYKSGKLKNVDQAADDLLRLLIHLKNQYHALLTPDQLQEIDNVVQSFVFEGSNKKEMKINGKRIGSSRFHENPGLELRMVKPSGGISGKPSLPNLEQPAMSRNRVLVDLHAKYDEGSLPSPTRENQQPPPMLQPIGVVVGAATASQPMALKNPVAEDTKLHLYGTDAIKAFSSYQQKYSRTTALPSNRLPSPTPSEEGNNNCDDALDEVSSTSVISNARSMNSASPFQLVRSSSGSASMLNSAAQQIAPIRTTGPASNASNSVMKTAAKSRDPRLKFGNTEVVGVPDNSRYTMSNGSMAPTSGPAGAVSNPRKHKVVNDSILNDHNSKRQRNGLSDPREAQTASGRGGWLESSSSVSPQTSNRVPVNENADLHLKKPGNGEISPERRLDGSINLTISNTGTIPSAAATAAGVSLPSFLENIAVNPTMLMQLLLEQQRFRTGALQNPVDVVQNSGINRVHTAVPVVNGGASNSSEHGQKQVGKSQMPPQTPQMSNNGNIRMKPRDPRRVLHNNVVQAASEETKSSGNVPSDTQMNKDCLRVRESGEQAQTTGVSSQAGSRSDIPCQTIINHRNNGNTITSLPMTTAPVAITQQSSSQKIANKACKVDVRPSMMESNDQKSATALPHEGGSSGTSQSSNPWGDVDHLLDGYDDQQKAAIQKERARRIEEQNKMFAARKLCLVLDLDHTLLNSAKFIEVDPIHDEILRKKEEQDREKPQRHLFRFPHMGMWTKLRPGIWNFLEKASKLFELHLYTMGNKLYATEMAKVLDPTGTLFAGRVISRGDDEDPLDGDERVPKSKDLDGVLGMESAVVIIDDSVRVWPHNKLNLILVERYTYFPCSRRQFGLPGPSLLEIDHDERPEDGTLASSLGVIERIHHNFFSHRSLGEVDVRNILSEEQRKILAGCKIVFSRVFPVGEANPHLHPLWQTAEQFGAICTNHINEHVTHVVANSLGTDKVNWALSTGRFVVHPGWVEASALLYRRANEHDFAVKP